uniref:Uncharacterized protein n=1 Tax=Solanum tuberosum TaxID=4113 RepID=M1D8I5_SOLTU
MFLELSSVRYKFPVHSGRDCSSFPPCSASLGFIRGPMFPRGRYCNTLELSSDRQQKIGEPQQGSRTVKGTTVRRPARGSGPSRRGGPRDLSRAVDHIMSRGKARVSQAKATRPSHQTADPFTGRDLDDGTWRGS